MPESKPVNREEVGIQETSGEAEANRGIQLKLYELFAQKMILELWCEAVYGFTPKASNKIQTKSVWTASTAVDWSLLPQELWLKILGYLPQAELYFNVYRVCKKLNALCRDTSLWTDIDFHEMHRDLVLMSEDRTDFVTTRVANSHFTNLLTVFSDHINSLKMSRYIEDCALHDATLKYLCMCTSMRKLDLGFCDDVNLSTIFKSCSAIVELNLEGCSNLQDDDFQDIFLLQNLERLCVSHCPSLTSKFLTYLYKQPNLRALICDGITRISEIAFINFFESQPLMEVLILDGEDMSDDLVISASQLPNLVTFELSFCQSLTSQSVHCFQGKFLLEHLKFRKAAEITSSSICKVFNPGARFSLKSFAITECESMDDNALICLSQSCPNLRSLTLDWCWKIDDKGLCEVVNNCKKLQRLSLIGLFNIEGVGWLDNLDKRLPHLQYLDTSDCNNMPDADLVDLVCRKRTIEVYTYYHDRVCVPSVSSESDASSDASEDMPPRIYICAGERGIEVPF